MSRSICYFRYKWKDLPWKKFQRTVYKLQKRIYKAASRGDVKIAYNEVAEAAKVVCCRQIFSCQTGNSGQ